MKWNVARPNYLKNKKDSYILIDVFFVNKVLNNSVLVL